MKFFIEGNEVPDNTFCQSPIFGTPRMEKFIFEIQRIGDNMVLVQLTDCESTKVIAQLNIETR